MLLWEAIYSQLPEWSPLSYKYRGAGTPWDEIPGFRLVGGAKRPATNCSVYVWASILRALERLGEPHDYSSALQSQAMVVDPAKHRAGPVDAVLSMGLGEVVDPDIYGPGVGPCVAQVWRRKGAISGGHALFLVGCASDAALGVSEAVWTLEANGRVDGSGPSLGLDGVGCRVKDGSGSWRDLGALPPITALYTWPELRERYPEMYIARLL